MSGVLGGRFSPSGSTPSSRAWTGHGLAPEGTDEGAQTIGAGRSAEATPRSHQRRVRNAVVIVIRWFVHVHVPAILAVVNMEMPGERIVIVAANR